MNDKIMNKVSEFFNTRLLSTVGDITIFQNDDGSYELFNRYTIQKNPYGFKVVHIYNSDEKLFSSLKNAVTWCVFENRKKYQKAQRIEYLDKMIAGMDLNIEMHKKLIKKSTDTEIKLIYAAKLSDEQNKKKIMLHEMSGYIHESKALQTQKFDAKR